MWGDDADEFGWGDEVRTVSSLGGGVIKKKKDSNLVRRGSNPPSNPVNRIKKKSDEVRRNSTPSNRSRKKSNEPKLNSALSSQNRRKDSEKERLKKTIVEELEEEQTNIVEYSSDDDSDDVSSYIRKKRKKNKKKVEKKERKSSKPLKFRKKIISPSVEEYQNLYGGLQRSKHNNICLSRPYISQTKRLRTPKDLYIRNDETDEEKSAIAQNNAFDSLSKFKSVLEKLKLIDGWIKDGNYDYPSLILILTKIRSSFKNNELNLFFQILQKRPKILEIYMFYLEQQLRYSRIHFKELQDLYKFLGREEDELFLLLQFAVFQQKREKNRNANLSDCFNTDTVNFSEAVEFVSQAQEKSEKSNNKKKRGKSKISGFSDEVVNNDKDEGLLDFTKQEEDEINSYEIRIEQSRKGEEVKIENINNLVKDSFKSKKEQKKFQKVQEELRLYIPLLATENHIEVLDREYNVQNRIKQEIREIEKEEKRKKKVKKNSRNKKINNAADEDEEELKFLKSFDERIEDQEYINTVTSIILKRKKKNEGKHFRILEKENLFLKYPRKNIYNFSSSEFMKYLLLFHFGESGINSAITLRDTINMSSKKYSLMALISRSKVGDWRAVLESLPNSKGKNKDSLFSFLPVFGSRNKEKELVVPVDIVLDVVSRYNPPRSLMIQIVHMENDITKRFTFAVDYQLFETAVTVSEQMVQEERMEKMFFLKRMMTRVLTAEKATKTPLMQKINYYINGGKVKSKKSKKGGWFSFQSGLSTLPGDD